MASMPFSIIWALFMSRNKDKGLRKSIRHVQLPRERVLHLAVATSVKEIYDTIYLLQNRDSNNTRLSINNHVVTVRDRTIASISVAEGCSIVYYHSLSDQHVPASEIHVPIIINSLVRPSDLSVQLEICQTWNLSRWPLQVLRLNFRRPSLVTKMGDPLLTRRVVCMSLWT